MGTAATELGNLDAVMGSLHPRMAEANWQLSAVKANGRGLSQSISQNSPTHTELQQWPVEHSDPRCDTDRGLLNS